MKFLARRPPTTHPRRILAGVTVWPPGPIGPQTGCLARPDRWSRPSGHFETAESRDRRADEFLICARVTLTGMGGYRLMPGE